jgi:hypothetical protein
MKHSNCPKCYSNLEVRDVGPCYVCGGWDGVADKFDPDYEHNEYELDSGETIILCKGCWLEEMLALQGELVSDLKLPLNRGCASGYRIARSVSQPQVTKDKYCPSCNKRLALLKVMVHRQAQS